ncbi:MAG: hypothetical protein AB1325_13740 [Nitrospirota bacterium]
MVGYKGPAIILLIFFSCVFLVQNSHAEWKDSKECFNLIKSGKHDTVISDAKSILKEDSWNADANACLVMAYYLSDRKFFAMKKIKEIEESLPKEVIDEIHDKIWNDVPELLAEKEYRNNYTISGGACILRNVASLDGTGYIMIGSYFNPFDSSISRHLRAYKCNSEMQGCKEIDHVCPDCKLREEEAKVIIKDYRIVEIKKLKNVELSRNIKYISKILELEQKDKK